MSIDKPLSKKFDTAATGGVPARALLRHAHFTDGIDPGPAFEPGLRHAVRPHVDELGGLQDHAVRLHVRREMQCADDALDRDVLGVGVRQLDGLAGGVGKRLELVNRVNTVRRLRRGIGDCQQAQAPARAGGAREHGTGFGVHAHLHHRALDLDEHTFNAGLGAE